jgi:hypothetical protein
MRVRCFNAPNSVLTKVNLLKPTTYLSTTSFNIQKFYVLPTNCICMFCVDVRINSYYFSLQHQLTGFYNRDEKCLQRGTDWVFKSDGYVEIKCQLDATDDFYCRSYWLLNMFRAPLCPSSGAREYYTGGWCLWYLVLWFSSCRYGVELRVMCPVCELLQKLSSARNMLSK